MRVVALALCLVSGAAAQLPEFYRALPRILWVVDDLDRIAMEWQKAGVPHDSADSPRSSNGRFRSLTARFANVRADWIQPLSHKSVWADCLQSRGSGIFALIYRVPSRSALDTEISRLRSVDVGILEQGNFQLAGGREVPYALFDTVSKGKYTIGLFYDPKPEAAGPAGPKVTQFALAVRDLDSVSAYWAKLGFPRFSFTHPAITDKRYKGAPADFDMRLGWQRHLSVPFEWIQSLQGPNVYEDHMAKQGEGFHHIAFDVPDMDKAMAQWQAWGFPVTMSGGWGQKGTPGSGRFAYHDTHRAGGIDIELLWNFRSPAALRAPTPLELLDVTGLASSY